jgi:hypothetical protein
MRQAKHHSLLVDKGWLGGGPLCHAWCCPADGDRAITGVRRAFLFDCDELLESRHPSVRCTGSRLHNLRVGTARFDNNMVQPPKRTTNIQRRGGANPPGSAGMALMFAFIFTGRTIIDSLVDHSAIAIQMTPGATTSRSTRSASVSD